MCQGGSFALSMKQSSKSSHVRSRCPRSGSLGLSRKTKPIEGENKAKLEARSCRPHQKKKARYTLNQISIPTHSDLRLDSPTPHILRLEHTRALQLAACMCSSLSSRSELKRCQMPSPRSSSQQKWPGAHSRQRFNQPTNSLMVASGSIYCRISRVPPSPSFFFHRFTMLKNTSFGFSRRIQLVVKHCSLPMPVSRVPTSVVP
jgi:hypothetical protein